MRRNIVEGEPGIFPPPVTAVLLRLSRWIRRGRRPRLKMMWDYDAFPLWDVGGPDVFVDDLPLSDELRAELQRWSDERSNVVPYDQWPSAEWMEQWDRRGRELLERVRRELGREYEVGYFNEATEKVEW